MPSNNIKGSANYFLPCIIIDLKKDQVKVIYSEILNYDLNSKPFPDSLSKIETRAFVHEFFHIIHALGSSFGIRLRNCQKRRHQRFLEITNELINSKQLIGKSKPWVIQFYTLLNNYPHSELSNKIISYLELIVEEETLLSYSVDDLNIYTLLKRYYHLINPDIDLFSKPSVLSSKEDGEDKKRFNLPFSFHPDITSFSVVESYAWFIDRYLMTKNYDENQKNIEELKEMIEKELFTQYGRCLKLLRDYIPDIYRDNEFSRLATSIFEISLMVPNDHLFIKPKETVGIRDRFLDLFYLFLDKRNDFNKLFYESENELELFDKICDLLEWGRFSDRLKLITNMNEIALGSEDILSFSNGLLIYCSNKILKLRNANPWFSFSEPLGIIQALHQQNFKLPVICNDGYLILNEENSDISTEAVFQHLIDDYIHRDLMQSTNFDRSKDIYDRIYYGQDAPSFDEYLSKKPYFSLIQ